MAAWLADPRFRRRARRATVIWRGIGWVLVAGPLTVRLFGLALPAGTWLVDSWLVQELAALGLAYAATWRVGAQALHYRIKREPMHLFGYRGILGREKWWHLVPGSRGVNKLEYRLRRGKPQKGRKLYHWRYFRRTVLAALIGRFWWAALALGGAVWWWGWDRTLGFLQVIGHRL
jgi:hypothetical protein